MSEIIVSFEKRLYPLVITTEISHEDFLHLNEIIAYMCIQSTISLEAQVCIVSRGFSAAILNVGLLPSQDPRHSFTDYLSQQGEGGRGEGLLEVLQRTKVLC